MSESNNQSDKIVFLVRGLAMAAAINCVVVPLFFAQQRPLFPFPGLYFIEIAILGIFGLIGLLLVEPDSPVWRAVPFVAAGVLLSFAVLAVFSIGFFLLPAAVAFFLAGILLIWREKGSIIKYLGLLLITAIIQAALMVMLAQIP